MQANMRLSNIARTAGLESDQHHCKNLAFLWAFMSQECFFFVLCQALSVSFSFCHRLVCFICILFHIISFVIVIVGLTYHQFRSLHALIFSLPEYICSQLFCSVFFLLHSAALVAVRLSQASYSNHQSFYPLTVLSTGNHNNVSIVFFSVLYFFSIIVVYQCLYCSNFVLCNLVFFSFNLHQNRINNFNSVR